ncbi:deoxycytidyl transferase [Coemansia sp. RSA 1939]|nr:deoxycytidyl transferase [Coemansia sp. RSA 1939]KAJ2609830.1 deoxycytidyl transferase [Coemansia sp. RSA 1804]
MSGLYGQEEDPQQTVGNVHQFGPEDSKHIPVNRAAALAEEGWQDKNHAAPAVSNPSIPGFGDFHGYFNQRKAKLAEQAAIQAAAHQPQHSQIFAGAVFHINGYTRPSQHELKRLLLARGGRFLHYLAKSEVTHIIASNLTMSKEKEFRNYRVVRPEWVMQSISAGRQLPWQRYRVIGQQPRRSNAEMISLGPRIACDLEEDEARLSQPGGNGGQSGPLKTATAFVVDRFGEGLNREWVRRNLATEPDFIQRYYASSRLHHLSMWKAELKDYVAQLRQTSSKARPNNAQGIALRSDRARMIMHVDFDCFFVSVSLLSYPHLKDRPVAVCHSHKQLEDFDSELSANPLGKTGGTSQIASCNYIARSFGVKNGMFMNQATQLCPPIMVVPYQFDAYRRVSRIFYKIVTQIADETQAVSVDEALLDVTHAVQDDRYCGDPELLAQDIRCKVLETTKCTVSVGIGPNILLARIATTSAKPNGVFYLDSKSFLDMDIPISRLPGVGYAGADNLSRNGLKSIADVRKAPLEELKVICGEKTALTLYNYSRGSDNRVVESNQLRQAFGADIGWGVRFSNQNEVEDFVTRTAQEVCKSMDAAGRTGSLVSLKIKRRQEGEGKPGKFLGHGRCDNLSRSASLPQMTSDPARIAPLCVRLLHQLAVDPLDVRGVGIHVQKLNTDGGAADIGKLLAKPKQIPLKESPDSTGYPSELLPSASRIDADVLKELPESIRSELQEAYKGKRPSANIGALFPGRPPLPNRDLVRKPLVVKSGRGRPRKLGLSTRAGKSSRSTSSSSRPKQNLVDAFNRMNSLDNIMPSQVDSEVWGNLPTSIRRELAREYVASKPKISEPLTKDGGRTGSASAVSSEQAPKAALHVVPTLLGKHELSDVRALVKEWVDSSAANGPLEEDVAEFCDYIVALIKRRDLFKAKSILVFWKMCVSRSDGDLWSAATKQLFDRADSTCRAMYNATLHI